MELPTYTNIWKIEKRLYKLYDFRLPMPLPIGQMAAFLAIAVPYMLILALVGMPFSHTWVWLYVLPPGLLAWLVTRPVLEGKRLPELVLSQLRYLGEPRSWCRMAPFTEKDEITVAARVWRRATPAGADLAGAAAILPAIAPELAAARDAGEAAWRGTRRTHRGAQHWRARHCGAGHRTTGHRSARHRSARQSGPAGRREATAARQRTPGSSRIGAESGRPRASSGCATPRPPVPPGSGSGPQGQPMPARRSAAHRIGAYRIAALPMGGRADSGVITDSEGAPGRPVWPSRPALSRRTRGRIPPAAGQPQDPDTPAAAAVTALPAVEPDLAAWPLVPAEPILAAELPVPAEPTSPNVAAELCGARGRTATSGRRSGFGAARAGSGRA